MMRRDERQGRGGRRRRLRGLVAAWAVYWVALLVWALWTPVSLFLRLKARGAGHAGLVFADDLRLRVTLDRATVWAANVSAGECLAWLVGPPLVLWMAWLWWSARSATRASVASPRAPAQLPPPDAVPSAGRAPAAGRVPTPERIDR